MGGRGEKEREKRDACLYTHTDVFFSCVLGAYGYRLWEENLLLRMKNCLCVRVCACVRARVLVVVCRVARACSAAESTSGPAH